MRASSMHPRDLSAPLGPRGNGPPELRLCHADARQVFDLPGSFDFDYQVFDLKGSKTHTKQFDLTASQRLAAHRSG